MPDIATLNGVDENNIATYNGTTAANVTSRLGNTWQHVAYTVATGGTETTDGDYKIRTFTSSGTFEITTLGTDAVADVLVVAAGGAGG